MNTQNTLNTVSDIVALLGGLTAMSKKLGHPHCTTVQGWSSNDRIPSWRRSEVKSLLMQEGITLPTDIHIRLFGSETF